MKIGITRIRNEEHIIQDTLDHVSKLVDKIIVLDDCSTDNTVEICKNHKAVIEIMRNRAWEADIERRRKNEGRHRQVLYERALKTLKLSSSVDNWIYYFDADEFADFEGIDWTADVYRLRLFDYYITPEDAHLSWKHRTKIGPEYRDIAMLFRANNRLRFLHRTPIVPNNLVTEIAGYVKHYGKAISPEEWDKTCRYYMRHRGNEFAKKWKPRIGKAIHTKSDFGANLITWDERVEKGYELKDRM
jgi:glycosyltransferase involved in cell wall biosynthesis